MIQQWWSRSSDDTDPVMMIQIQINMTWRWRWLEYEYDLKMKMMRTWWWSRWYEKNICADKLCRENTFLVNRECWWKCNFRMYSHVYLMYCTLMFILGSVCNVIESSHAPMFRSGSFYNVNKSCQVIVGNPPIDQGLKFPHLWGPMVIRISHKSRP